MKHVASPGTANPLAPLKLRVKAPLLNHFQLTTLTAPLFNFTSDKFHDALAGHVQKGREAGY